MSGIRTGRRPFYGAPDLKQPGAQLNALRERKRKERQDERERKAAIARKEKAAKKPAGDGFPYFGHYELLRELGQGNASEGLRMLLEEFVPKIALRIAYRPTDDEDLVI